MSDKVEIVIDDYYDEYRQSVIVGSQQLKKLQVGDSIIFNQDRVFIAKFKLNLKNLSEYNVLKVSWISQEHDKMRLFLSNCVFDTTMLWDEEWKKALKTIYEVDFMTNLAKGIKARPLQLS